MERTFDPAVWHHLLLVDPYCGRYVVLTSSDDDDVERRTGSHPSTTSMEDTP